MAATEPNIEARVRDLERRVVALELRAGGSAEAPARRETMDPASPPDPGPPPALPASPEPEPRPDGGGAPVALEAVLARKQAALRARQESDAAPSPPVAPPTRAPNPPVVAPPSGRGQPRAEADHSGSMERLVGGRWFAALGALIVIAGLGLSLKLAWDAGWLRLPPVGRVLGVAGFGAVLIGLGEVALRRLGRAASAGLFGAGVGAMFVAAFGAHALYALIPVGAAFVLMAVVCALGVGIALRAQLVSIGILAVVGGYLTPLIARAPDASAWAMPVYLLGLTGVGVALGVWQRRFGAVRVVCWAGTTLVGTLWALGPGGASPLLALGFVGAVWGGYQLDTARRVRPRDGDPGGAMGPLTPAGSRMLLGAVALTGWASFLGWALGQSAGLEPWMVPAALGVACAMGSAVFAGGMRVLREAPRTDGERYGVVLTALAGSELFAALALGLSGWIETTTWLVAGTLIVLGGRAARARGLVWYGLALLGFGVARAVCWEPTVGGLHAGGVETLGLVLTGWTGLLAVSAAALVVSARAVWQPSGDWHVTARTLGGLAVGLLALGLVHDGADPHAVYLAWAALAVAVSAAGRAEGRLRLETVAPGLVGLAVIAWAVAELEPGWSSARAAPGLHPGLWGAALLAAVGLAVMRAARVPRGDAWAWARALPWVGGLVLMFGATSLEVARTAELLLDDRGARAGAMSTWWGVFGVGMIVAGSLRRVPPARWAGLGLVLLAAGKAVVVDLAGSSDGVRVASFLALGLLMLLVAAGYLRGARRRAVPAPGGPDGPGGAGATGGP